MQTLSCCLTEHIFRRSEACFDRSDSARSAVADTEDFKAYAEGARSQFFKSIGEIPYDPSLPLKPEITASTEDGGLVIENVVFEARPGVFVTANTYRLRELKGPAGGVLLLMGHSENGKNYSAYQRAAQVLAGAGLFVLAVDPTGQGERSNYVKDGRLAVKPGVPDHDFAGDQCVLADASLIKYFMADAMRAVDYMISRPEVDPERIGATGISGGGTQTSYMMVCDERIKAAAPGCSLTVKRAYLRTGIEQDAEKIWIGGTEGGFDYNELVLCFCPKPLLILACDHDYVPLAGTVKCYLDGLRMWKLLGRGNDIGIAVDQSPHGFTEHLARTAAEFFAKALNGETYRPAPAEYEPLPDETLRCTPTGQVSELPGARSIFDENLSEYHRRASDSGSAADALDALREAVYSTRFREETEPSPERADAALPAIGGITPEAFVWNTQQGLRCFGGLWRSGRSNRLTVCLWPDGTLAAETHSGVIGELLKRGGVLVCDLSGSGRCAPNDEIVKSGICQKVPTLSRLNKDLLFMGDSLFALRLYDLSRTFVMLRGLGFVEITVYAEGIDTLPAKAFRLLENAEIALADERSARELVEGKYYDRDGVELVIHPGIAYLL